MSAKKLLLQTPGTRGTLDRLYKQRAPTDTTGNFSLRKKALELHLSYKHHNKITSLLVVILLPSSIPSQ